MLLGPNGLNLLAGLSPPWLLHSTGTPRSWFSQKRGSLKENVFYDARISPNCPVGLSFRFYWLSFHTSHLPLDFAASCLWTSSQPKICSCLRLLQCSPNWLVYFFFSLRFLIPLQRPILLTKILQQFSAFLAPPPRVQKETQASACISPCLFRPQHPLSSSSLLRVLWPSY